MSDLRDLYQEVILDHSRSPRNFGGLETANRTAEGYNPLCGDRLNLYLSLDGDVVTDARFEGSGCAISTASASMMTEAVKGKTVQEATVLFERFHNLVTSDNSGTGGTGDDSLGKLDAFAGVRRFPARVKCATLVWHTLRAAINDRDDVVTTE